MITSNLFSQPGGMPTQSRSFSKNSKEGRGDTSVWTDNPLDRAQKAKMKYDYCLFSYSKHSFIIFKIVS